MANNKTTAVVSTEHRHWVMIAMVFSCLLIATGFSLQHDFFHDDAYITLRYSQNWLAGEGIVWNPGERVEGYTSFLHLAFITLVGKLGGDLPAISRGIGIASWLAICWIIAFVFRSPSPSTHYSPRAVLILLIPSSFPLIAWSVGGLETTLYTALLMLLTYRFSQFDISSCQQPIKLIGFGLLLACVTMTRPEAILFVFITGLFTLFGKDLTSRNWRALGILTVSFLGLWIPYFLWRWNYYGDFFPNTYYAKMNTEGLTRLANGFYYLHTFARIPPFLLLLGLACPLLALLRLRCSDHHQRFLGRPIAYMLTIAVVATVYVCYTGGDHMPAYRFMVPILPIYSWLIAISVPVILPGLIKQTRWPVMVVLMVIVLLQVSLSILSLLDARHRDPAAAVGQDVGIWIRDHFPASCVIALNTAGSTPFHAPDQQFIDMLGLNDRHIAKRQETPMLTAWQQFPGHSKGDGQYVLSRKPDFIILGPAQGLPANTNFAASTDVAWFLSDQELAASSQFYQQYRMRKVTFQGASGKTRTLVYYERRAIR